MDKCKVHEYSITHICCSEECLQVLCGKCVVEHLLLHKKKNSWPELFTLEELKTFCKGKLETAISQIKCILNQVSQKKNEEKAIQAKINEESLYLHKKRLLAFIDEYFKNLEGFSQKECDKLSRKIEGNIGDLHRNCEEIQEKLINIDNSSVFEGLLTIFRTDYQGNSLKVEEKFKDLLKEKYLLAFKESNFEVFKPKFFDLINEFLVENIDKKEFRISCENSFAKTIENSFEKNTKNNEISAKKKKSMDSSVISKSVDFSKKKDEKSIEKPLKTEEIPRKSVISIEEMIEKKHHEIVDKKPLEKSVEILEKNLQKSEKKHNEIPEPKKTTDFFTNSFEITQSNYFTSSKEPKCLHFFEECSKNLYLLPLEKLYDPSVFFSRIPLLIPFLIPLKSRSIITPEGLIYLLGGFSSEIPTNTYFYDNFNQTLQSKAPMNSDRESFGIAYFLNEIYVCGGSDEYGNKLNSCEKYDYFSNTWTKIAALNQKASGLYLTAFNEKFIVKFGGESTQTLLSQIIEIYEGKTNKWTVIQAVSESNLIPVISRLGACVQINEENIMVFGGYYAKNDAGTNQCFLLEINEKERKFAIKRLNEKLLPHCAGFWNNMPVVEKGEVICLQNVTDSEDKGVSLQDRRRVLVFDGKEWKKVK